MCGEECVIMIERMSEWESSAFSCVGTHTGIIVRVADEGGAIGGRCSILFYFSFQNLNISRTIEVFIIFGK